MTSRRLDRHAGVVMLVIAMITACAKAPLNYPLKVGEANTGPGTLTQARQYLEGRWSLVRMDLFPPNQPVVHAAASGTMVYDDYANMNVEMQLNPETIALAERLGIPVQQGFVKTTGRTVIDVQNRTLSYVLEGQEAIRPAVHPLDLNRPRHWEVSGNLLTLRTKDEAGKVLSESVWKKDG